MDWPNFKPILSTSFYNFLKDIQIDNSNPIIQEILNIHELIEWYNQSKWCFPEIVFTTFNETIKSKITDEVSMLSFRHGSFEVSFLPKGKDPEYNENGDWSRANRQTGKPAKIFQKLLVREFKASEWEAFSNLLKSELCDCVNFQLVEGEDIRKWYNEENYYRINGSLGNSCMRYASCSKYFDLYVDHAKMLITTKNGSLTGRAIVWELEDKTLLDRIYVTDDYLVDCFITYAKEHKWWYRECNSLLSSGDDQYWYTPDDNYTQVVRPTLSIHLNKEYNYFPYVDSFRYYDGYAIYTTSDFGPYTLDCTDGHYMNDFSEYVCVNCGHTSRGYDGDMPDDIVYSNWADDYYCTDCAWYCDFLDDYIPVSEETCNIHDEGKIWDVPEAWIDENLSIGPFTGDERGNKVVEIAGEYYFVRNLIFNEKTKLYEIRSNS